MWSSLLSSLAKENNVEIEAFRSSSSRVDIELNRKSSSGAFSSSVFCHHSTGLGLRVSRNGIQGFAWTSELGEKEVERTFKDALNQTKSMPIPISVFPNENVKAEDLNLLDKRIRGLEFDDFVEEIISLSKDIDIEIEQRIRISFIYDKLAINNTAGGEFSVEETLASLNVRMQTSAHAGYAYSHARHLNDLTPGLALKEAAEDAMFHSVKALQGTPKFDTVVFHPNAFSALIYLVLIPYLAGTALNPLRYPFKPKFSESMRIEDNGRTPGRVGSSILDHEGVPTSNKVIIRNGSIESLILDLTAAKMRNVQSTGNGFREVKVDDKLFGHRKELYKSRPRVCPTNLNVVGEKTMEFSEMLKHSITELYIKRLFWPQGCPTCAGGKTMFPIATGYLIRRGEPQQKVKHAALVLDSMVNISDIFRSIDFTSSDSIANYICCPWVVASKMQLASYDRSSQDVVAV